MSKDENKKPPQKTAKQKREEKVARKQELLELFANNARAKEALDTERREAMSQFRDRNAAIKESNKKILAELDNIDNPLPLGAFAEKQEEMEEEKK